MDAIMNSAFYDTDRIVFGILMIIATIASMLLSGLMIICFWRHRGIFSKSPVFIFCYNLIATDFLRNINCLANIIPVFYLADSKKEQEHREALVFVIISELSIVGYIAWIILITFLTINRLLTFYKPSVIRKNTFYQILCCSIFAWVFAIAVDVIKMTWDVSSIEGINIHTRENNKNYNFEGLIVCYYLINPTVLFLMYLASFYKVRSFTRVNGSASVGTRKSASTERQPVVINSIKFESLILRQGIMICTVYQMSTLLDYFAEEIIRFLGPWSAFYFNVYLIFLVILFNSINALTFFCFNKTAIGFLRKMFLPGTH
uniref:G_PROTEIN_RECEP_F1_2 domain-containing protein n=1 Tax=Rhabditophanes sp. KR3021 TaxID=114890 RepID=A0AC35UFC4_9BILA